MTEWPRFCLKNHCISCGQIKKSAGTSDGEIIIGKPFLPSKNQGSSLKFQHQNKDQALRAHPLTLLPNTKFQISSASLRLVGLGRKSQRRVRGGISGGSHDEKPAACGSTRLIIPRNSRDSRNLELLAAYGVSGWALEPIPLGQNSMSREIPERTGRTGAKKCMEAFRGAARPVQPGMAARAGLALMGQALNQTPQCGETRAEAASGNAKEKIEATYFFPEEFYALL